MSTTIPADAGGQDTSVQPQSEMDVLNADDSTDDNDTVVGGDTDEESTPEETSTTETTTETDDDEVTVDEDEDVVSDDETTEEPTEDEDTTKLDDTEITRPSWQLIKEKYPELAKNRDFRTMYHRDKAMTELYPTVESAQEASAKAEAFDALDSKLVEGDINTVFGNIDKDVLKNISTKILPALFAADREAFRAATRPLIIDLFNNVLETAEQNNDGNLRKSIRNVYKVLTGTSEIPKRSTPTEKDPQVEQELNRLKTAREQLFQNEQKKFLTTTDRAVVKRLEKLVSEGLDLKKELTDFARQAVIEKTLADVKRTLIGDEGLTNKIRTLHRQAVKANFPDEYRARIISASLERARKLIPVLRNKHFTAALGKQQPKGNSNTKVVTKNETVRTGAVTTDKGGSSVSAKNIDMRKTSPIDFLNDKVVLKK